MIGVLKDGGKMVSIITYTNEVYFILLYENTWKLVRKIKPLSSIFSLQSIKTQSNAIVTVSNGGVNIMEVNIV
jgi:hypothetical protein